MSAAQMAAAVKKATAGWDYDAVSIGFPGPVKNDGPAREPRNLGAGWVHFDFAKAFGKPVKVVNDAAMQALGSYQGGRMLFLGLGTGLGSALVADGVLAPLELAHLPVPQGPTYEDYVGLRGYKRLGAKQVDATRGEGGGDPAGRAAGRLRGAGRRADQEAEGAPARACAWATTRTRSSAACGCGILAEERASPRPGPPAPPAAAKA